MVGVTVATLPGPGRTIVVEPLEAPREMPAPPPEPEPAPAQAPAREAEPVPALPVTDAERPAA